MKRLKLMWRPLRRLVLVALCLTLVATATAADRPHALRLLPERTLVYFRIESTPELIQRFQVTGVGRMAKDQRLQPLLGQFWQMAAEAFRGVEQQINAPLGDLLAIAQGEICLAVVAPKDGRPETLVWLDCGNKLPVVRRILDRADQLLFDQRAVRREVPAGDVQMVVHEIPGWRRPFIYVIKDSCLLIASHEQLARQALHLWSGKGPRDAFTLADNRQFATIMDRSRSATGENPHITWFVDPFELARQMGRGNFSAQAGLAALTGLGIDGIQGLGGTVTFATEQFDDLFHTHLLLDNPRQGVLKALAIRSGDVQPEPWVPPDVTSYLTMNWDVTRSYGEVVNLFELFRGEGSWEAEVLAPALDHSGINPDREIVRALAGRATIVTWMERPVRINGQTRLIGLQLRDTEASRKVLERLAARFSEQLTKKTFAGITYYERPMPRNPRAGEAGDIWRQEVICIAVFDQYLFFCNSSKLLQQAIISKSDAARRLSNEKDYQAIASRIKQQLGRANAGMISFSRPEETMRQMYDLANAENMRARLRAQGEGNSFFRGLDGALTDHPLPPFSVIAPYLSPRGAFLTNDESGFHYMAFALRPQQ